jgi:hypothetical protein
VGTQFDFKTSKVRSFVFDTRTREFHAPESNSREGRAFDSSDQAASNAWGDAQTHVQTDPDSYWMLYKRYRHRWPRYVFFAILAAGEIGIFFYVRESWKRPLTTDQGLDPAVEQILHSRQRFSPQCGQVIGVTSP